MWSDGSTPGRSQQWRYVVNSQESQITRPEVSTQSSAVSLPRSTNLPANGPPPQYFPNVSTYAHSVPATATNIPVQMNAQPSDLLRNRALQAEGGVKKKRSNRSSHARRQAKSNTSQCSTAFPTPIHAIQPTMNANNTGNAGYRSVSMGIDPRTSTAQFGNPVLPHFNATATHSGQTQSSLRAERSDTVVPPVAQIPNTAVNNRFLSSNRGLMTRTSLGDLINVCKDFMTQFSAWKSFDKARREEDSQTLKNVLEHVTILSKDVQHISQKLMSSKGLDSPLKAEISSLAGIAHFYCANADPACALVREAAAFAVQNSIENVETLISSTVQLKRASKTTNTAVLSIISRGQSRAYDVLQREIISVWYQFCPQDSPLRAGSSASEKVKSEFSAMLLDTRLHMRSSSYDEAWFHACIMARSKARATAIATAADIKLASCEPLPPIWAKDENDAQNHYLDMSVGSYAFVLTKVNFALRRRCANKSSTRELNVSHQVPWARTALQVNNTLSEALPEENARIGRINFPCLLQDKATQQLEQIISGKTSTITAEDPPISFDTDYISVQEQ